MEIGLRHSCFGRVMMALAGHNQHSPRGKKEMKEIIETPEVTQKTYC